MRGRHALLGSLILLHAAAAAAEAPAAENKQQAPSPARQAVYKGVVGNLLEALPLDPEERVKLQRANAVISNPMTARTAATMLGLASPPLMIIGFIWGLIAASNIKPPDQLADQSTTVPLPSSPAAPVPIALQSNSVAPANPQAQSAQDPFAGFRTADSSRALAAIIGNAGVSDSALACETCALPLIFVRTPLAQR